MSADAPANATVGTVVIDAGEAGSVTVDLTDGVLTLVAVTPGSGWQVVEQRADGHEVKVELTNGTLKTEVEAGIEHGAFTQKVKTEPVDSSSDATVGSADSSPDAGVSSNG